jgi:hypothetical protein
MDAAVRVTARLRRLAGKNDRHGAVAQPAQARE